MVGIKLSGTGVKKTHYIDTSVHFSDVPVEDDLLPIDLDRLAEYTRYSGLWSAGEVIWGEVENMARQKVTDMIVRDGLGIGETEIVSRRYDAAIYTFEIIYTHTVTGWEMRCSHCGKPVPTPSVGVL